MLRVLATVLNLLVQKKDEKAMRNPKVFFIVALWLAGLMPGTAGAQSESSSQETQALRKQLDEMRTQMNNMQARLDQLEAAKTEPNANQPSAVSPQKQNGTIQTTRPMPQAPTSPQVGQQTSTYQEYSEDVQAAPRYNNVPTDPKYHGFFYLPGTDTMLKIGGYAKTDLIYDLKPAGNTDSFVPSSIPVPQPVSVNNFTASVRPTRLSLDFRVPSSTFGEVRFYLEGDLFGTNATTPRLRHAYGQARNLLIGQTFSNFMDPDASADTLDFQGPNGYVSLRNPQVRYGFALNRSTTLYISAEKPSADVAFKTAQFSAQTNSPAPDGTIRIRNEFERGHVQVAAIFRSIGAFLPDGRSDSVFGWGFNAATSLKTFGRDTFILEGAYGHGISRYIQDTSGLGIDAEPADNANPHLKATPAVGVEVAYQHYWIAKLRSNLVYGYAGVENTNFEESVSNPFNHSHYSAVNLIWNPYGSLFVGSEFLYGGQVLKDGSFAYAPRIQFSAKYSFVRIDPPQK
jgi:outer membrane DcaP-like protein